MSCGVEGCNSMHAYDVASLKLGSLPTTAQYRCTLVVRIRNESVLPPLVRAHQRFQNCIISTPRDFACYSAPQASNASPIMVTMDFEPSPAAQESYILCADCGTVINSTNGANLCASFCPTYSRPRLTTDNQVSAACATRSTSPTGFPKSLPSFSAAGASASRPRQRHGSLPSPRAGS